jgi:hypothetical protein
LDLLVIVPFRAYTTASTAANDTFGRSAMLAEYERELEKARKRLAKVKELANSGLTADDLKDLRKCRKAEFQFWLYVVRLEKRKKSGR